MTGLRLLRAAVLALSAAGFGPGAARDLPAPVPTAITVASPRGERRIAVRTERGFPALNARSLAAVLSLRLDSSAPGNAALNVAGRPFAFTIGAGYFRFDGRMYSLAAPPYQAADSLFVPLQWAIEYLPQLLPGSFRYDPRTFRLEEMAAPQTTASSGSVPAAARRRRIVAVDPGHGGRDVGMLGPIGSRPFLREKDVSLAVGRALGRELERRGVGVVLTRNRDTLVGRVDRGRIAGRGGAVLFVSIHVNAADPRWRRASAARGFETYFLAEARTEDERRVARMENASIQFETDAAAPRGDPLSHILNDLAQNEHLRESSRAAELIQESLAAVHPGESRGVKQAAFDVLVFTYMPAILVELGFGSNAAEARFLTSAAGQQRLAAAIADGVVRWLEEYERRVAP